MVLGSTCFAKRYGSSNALGTARFGSTGSGRVLTSEERQLLMDNTEALLAQFENEYENALSQVAVIRPNPIEEPLSPLPITLQRSQGGRSATLERPVSSVKESPWAWMKPMSSTVYFSLRNGSGWVRVQRNDGKQLLVPWPIFDGWDKALPPHIGAIDAKCQAYVMNDVVPALDYLRSLARWKTAPGLWRDVSAEIAKRNRW